MNGEIEMADKTIGRLDFIYNAKKNRPVYARRFINGKLCDIPLKRTVYTDEHMAFLTWDGDKDQLMSKDFARLARKNGYWMDVKIRSVGHHFVGTWDIFDQVIEDDKVFLCISDGTFLEENGLSL